MISDGTLKAWVVVKSIQIGRFWIEFEVKEKKILSKHADSMIILSR